MTDEPSTRIERLSQAARALGTAVDLEPFLQTVISIASELTDSQAASVLEYDEASDTLRFLAAPWFHWESLRAINVPVDGSAAGWVYREGKPLHIPDTRADARHFRAVDFASAFETRSLLAVPLMVRGKPLGVLEAVNKNTGHYTEEDTTILEMLAASTAAMIHNTRQQARIEASYLELSELDRLKNDFIAITSHELRTPLGLILGHATFLRELLGQEYHDQLDVIIKNASRLKEIIENLSSVDNYRKGAARVRQRTVSVTQIIQEVVNSFSDMAAKQKVTLKAETGTDELWMEGDGTKISIAISNLVKNAITFTDTGGHVTVIGEAVPDYIRVSVVDDGIGIPARDLPRIFERFFQVETHLTRKHGGMGLGLSVAKVMIDMHGGRIWAESVEGKGSSFTFLLPVSGAQATSG